jgi:hypothetical protein
MNCLRALIQNQVSTNSSSHHAVQRSGVRLGTRIHSSVGLSAGRSNRYARNWQRPPWAAQVHAPTPKAHRRRRMALVANRAGETQAMPIGFTQIERPPCDFAWVPIVVQPAPAPAASARSGLSARSSSNPGSRSRFSWSLEHPARADTRGDDLH